MLPINDPLDAILLGCFFFGLIFAGVSVLVGSLDIGGHGSGDISGGHAGHGGDHGAHDGHGLTSGVLTVSSVLAFVGWFGGIGYLAHVGLGWFAPVAVLIGLTGGVVGAAIVVLFMRRVIAPADRAMDPGDYELKGMLARVSAGINPNGTGEVVYEQQGYRKAAPARSLENTPIGRGVDVVVMDVRNGIAYVQTWDDVIECTSPDRMERVLAEHQSTMREMAPDVPPAVDVAEERPRAVSQE